VSEVHGGGSEARAEILRRIREALGEGMAPVEVPRDYQRALPSAIDLVELFAERVADYRATVRRTSRAGLPGVLAAALSARRAQRIAEPAGLPAEWLARAAVERVADDPPLRHEQLDDLDGVVTGCAVAIAETGTIVLDAGPAQGRRALSLLPDYHLCVVDSEKIVGSVPEALEWLDARRPQTWISGPSATSDIELQRVEGVHGPRNLEVVIIERPSGVT
jgi:L-lactate dehydrogenase complex protein LldG